MKIYHHYSIYGFSNTYILGNEDTKSALIVDPAEISPLMIDQIENNKYQLCAILVTHNHIHHIRGLKTLLRIYEPTVYASNARLFGITCRKVRDQDILDEAGFQILAIAVPGHSQDSIAYKIDNVIFSGDALHAGLIGKTTSSFNAQALAERLTSRILCYDDDVMIFPGHGPPTTVGTEKRFNLGLRPGFAKLLHPNYDFFV